MTLTNVLCENIHYLLQAGMPYRVIAEQIGISPTTISSWVKRHNETGSIYPPRERKSIYDQSEGLITERIRYFLRLLTTGNYKDHITKITHKQILDKLREEGFSISTSKAKELVKLEKNRLKTSFLDIHHDPSLMCQFDWGQKKLKIGNENRIVTFAVFALPYSNYRKVYITQNMNSGSFLEAFLAFINEMNGVFPILLIDNMKIAARYSSYAKKGKQLTRLFEELSEFYKFEVRFCTPYRPNQKGTVENAVKTLKNHLFDNGKEFDSIAELQKSVNQVFDLLNKRQHPDKNDTCYRLMLHEKSHLIQLPKKMLIYHEEVIRTVRNNTLVCFDKNSYSAPEQYKGEKIIVRFNDRFVRLKSLDGKILAKYVRCHGQKQKRYRIWYMLNKLRMKHHGFPESREYRSMPTWLRFLYEKTFKKESDNFLSFLEVIQGIKLETIKKIVTSFNNGTKNYDITNLLDSFVRC